MLEHIADFTAWPILTGVLVGYVANRIMSGEGKGYLTNFGRLGTHHRLLRSWCSNCVVALEETV